MNEVKYFVPAMQANVSEIKYLMNLVILFYMGIKDFESLFCLQVSLGLKK